MTALIEIIRNQTLSLQEFENSVRNEHIHLKRASCLKALDKMEKEVDASLKSLEKKDQKRTNVKLLSGEIAALATLLPVGAEMKGILTDHAGSMYQQGTQRTFRVANDDSAFLNPELQNVIRGVFVALRLEIQNAFIPDSVSAEDYVKHRIRGEFNSAMIRLTNPTFQNQA